MQPSRSDAPKKPWPADSQCCAQTGERARPSALIVEDQALIGMTLEAYLEEMGCAVQEIFASSAKALAWLSGNTPCFAVVDFMLNDGPCLELIRELRRRQVPLIIYSGRRKDQDAPEELRDVPWVEKPASREMLVNALASVVPEIAGLAASR